MCGAWVGGLDSSARIGALVNASGYGSKGGEVKRGNLRLPIVGRLRIGHGGKGEAKTAQRANVALFKRASAGQLVQGKSLIGVGYVSTRYAINLPDVNGDRGSVHGLRAGIGSAPNEGSKARHSATSSKVAQSAPVNVTLL